MKISVKTLKGSSFEIDVQPEDKVADVKRNIETTQGKSLYPAEEQMLIHQGKILKDDTTLAANNVMESNFLVIMKNNKVKGSSAGASTKVSPANQAVPNSTVPPVPSVPASGPSQTPVASLTSVTRSAPAPTATAAAPPAIAVSNEVDPYDQAASNLVAGSNLEQTVHQLLDMGGGTWDRDMVTRALRAAFNNPERAVEYLYSGIPESVSAPAVAQAPISGTNSPVQVPLPVQPPVPSAGPNVSPLDLLPQGLPNVGSDAGAGSLDFLRNTPQFQALQGLVQANPQILQPMLQELAKQNPEILRLIQEHQGEFLRLMNERAEGGESNLLGQLADAVPQAITVTAEEREAIERLEAMGFDKALVLEVFYACNKNEELAANYLLDHMLEFED